MGHNEPVSDLSERGRIIGKYEVVARLSVGGMAELFLACAAGPGGFKKFFAVKQILPDVRSDATFVRMFLDEARLTAALVHPNVGQVVDLGLDPDQGDLYLAMEFISGQNLARLIKVSERAGKILPLGVSCRIVHDMCLGLHAAHEMTDAAGRPLNVVHRDVTPKNVMVSYAGHVKVIDFGIARARGSLRMTQPGQMRGTLSYISPEQVLDHPLDARTDLFAAATILYELLTGRRMHTDDLSAARSVVVDTPPSPSRWNPEVPPALDALVMKALQKSPEHRPASARAFARELGEVVKLAYEEDIAALMDTYFTERKRATQSLLETLATETPEDTKVSSYLTGLVDSGSGSHSKESERPPVAASVTLTPAPTTTVGDGSRDVTLVARPLVSVTPAPVAVGGSVSREATQVQRVPGAESLGDLLLTRPSAGDATIQIPVATAVPPAARPASPETATLRMPVAAAPPAASVAATREVPAFNALKAASVPVSEASVTRQVVAFVPPPEAIPPRPGQELRTTPMFAGAPIPAPPERPGQAMMTTPMFAGAPIPAPHPPGLVRANPPAAAPVERPGQVMMTTPMFAGAPIPSPHPPGLERASVPAPASSAAPPDAWSFAMASGAPVAPVAAPMAVSSGAVARPSASFAAQPPAPAPGGPPVPVSVALPPGPAAPGAGVVALPPSAAPLPSATSSVPPALGVAGAPVVASSAPVASAPTAPVGTGVAAAGEPVADQAGDKKTRERPGAAMRTTPMWGPEPAHAASAAEASAEFAKLAPGKAAVKTGPVEGGETGYKLFDDEPASEPQEEKVPMTTAEKLRWVFALLLLIGAAVVVTGFFNKELAAKEAAKQAPPAVTPEKTGP
jgi:serine/threonine-protein kinase